ncbi:MAG: class I SAM-dependent methyltransferase [Sulfuricurvum sp.]|jgi:ubiquinone/menaquinone biosynthesis C-methylase UbiE|uniref:class I SAM-dependent methyltransferase n=1 Tax=Sulfuricurvum sp. TaxID=2025608 RepID=UPI0025CEE27A|nr:methyltransferase domain-containing protein [Sulfuricurvum sp.]MCK9373014.1 class I SAM-dependent methyltransferase [Sulfuricurvum sp.]
MMQNRANHFDTIADEFNGLWQMTPDYRNWMSETIVSVLDLRSDECFVDLGGGTGSYTRLIAKKADLQSPALCVEPSKKMLSQIEESDHLKPVHADALSFCTSEIRYDKILLKEMIHFVEERKALFQGIKRQLCENGRVLIVTRPKNTPLPFFTAALERFAQGQPSVESLEKELEDAGLRPFSRTEEFSFGISKERWYGMLRNRFMSNLQNFTDEEIEEGIVQLEKTFEAQTIIAFRDRIIFICGEPL